MSRSLPVPIAERSNVAVAASAIGPWHSGSSPGPVVPVSLSEPSPSVVSLVVLAVVVTTVVITVVAAPEDSSPLELELDSDAPGVAASPHASNNVGATHRNPRRRLIDSGRCTSRRFDQTGDRPR